MLALGSCMAGVGLLLTALLALLFRHPNAPRWTRPEIIALLACVPVAVTTGVGLGYVGFGVSELVSGTGDPRELLVLLGMLIVLALMWRGLRIRKRLKDYALASGATAPSAYLATQPTLVIDETPPPPPRPRTPRSSRTAA
ncbi:MAG: hypothetical protein ACREJ5_11670 [Geminicoccaceae bacterium]